MKFDECRIGYEAKDGNGTTVFIRAINPLDDTAFCDWYTEEDGVVEFHVKWVDIEELEYDPYYGLPIL